MFKTVFEKFQEIIKSFFQSKKVFEKVCEKCEKVQNFQKKISNEINKKKSKKSWK